VPTQTTLHVPSSVSLYVAHRSVYDDPDSTVTVHDQTREITGVSQSTTVTVLVISAAIFQLESVTL